MRVFDFAGRARRERSGFALYAGCVRAARDPWYFRELGVPDTLDGRFDLVGLFAALLIRRLRREKEGQMMAQAVFDAMFADMDMNLREMGVADLSVGKRVRAMWEAFHGRALAYQPALDAGDAAALAAALARNVWRGAAPAGSADRLARLAMAQAGALDGQDLAALQSGDVVFLPPVEMAGSGVPG